MKTRTKVIGSLLGLAGIASVSLLGTKDMYQEVKVEEGCMRALQTSIDVEPKTPQGYVNIVTKNMGCNDIMKTLDYMSFIPLTTVIGHVPTKRERMLRTINTSEYGINNLEDLQEAARRNLENKLEKDPSMYKIFKN